MVEARRVVGDTLVSVAVTLRVSTERAEAVTLRLSEAATMLVVSEAVTLRVSTERAEAAQPVVVAVVVAIMAVAITVALLPGVVAQWLTVVPAQPLPRPASAIAVAKKPLLRSA